MSSVLTVIFIFIIILAGSTPLEAVHQGGQEEAGEDGSNGHSHSREDDDEKVCQ